MKKHKMGIKETLKMHEASSMDQGEDMKNAKPMKMKSRGSKQLAKAC